MQLGHSPRSMDRSRPCNGFRDASPVCLLAIAFFLLAGTAAASTSFISDGALGSHGLTGRSLLQAKSGCPVNFEFMNYTVITSKCRGPQYPAKFCCEAFKEFACPYAEQLNELTSDCSSTMFSYINLYGKYPPGLFASECQDSKRGLECTVEQKLSSGPIASAATEVNVALPSVGALWFLFTFLFI